jgi:hypothetical protein
MVAGPAPDGIAAGSVVQNQSVAGVEVFDTVQSAAFEQSFVQIIALGAVVDAGVVLAELKEVFFGARAKSVANC